MPNVNWYEYWDLLCYIDKTMEGVLFKYPNTRSSSLFSRHKIITRTQAEWKFKLELNRWTIHFTLNAIDYIFQDNLKWNQCTRTFYPICMTFNLNVYLQVVSIHHKICLFFASFTFLESNNCNYFCLLQNAHSYKSDEM